MTYVSRRTPKSLKRELDRTGMPWEIEPGRKHYKVKLDGQIVGVLPQGSGYQEGSAAQRVLFARIRRYAREGRT